ncbi:MAG: DUF2270 domain-containing protein [Planctomycetales bacterium]|nr:DUF2270 domain-containing protein [Planctomycetales bacterium]
MPDSPELPRHFGADALHADRPELTRVEYITAVIHFYRAEMQRATQWRMRLDNTTNWSILATTAVVTFTFGQKENSHASIIVGMLMVLTFMLVEARRFRIFDVWSERTRRLERNFISPILLGDPAAATPDWGRQMAADLREPRFNMTWLQAVRARLIRNYASLFLLLLACWIVKLQGRNNGNLHDQASWLEAMRVGPVAGGVIAGGVALLYAGLIATAILGRRSRREEDFFLGPEIDLE